ncbi:MAG TPA: MBL fold metallo-hydrolase [Polyangiaceae bacterium]
MAGAPRFLRRLWSRRWLRVLVGVLALVSSFVGFLVVDAWEATGARARGERLTRVEASPHWKDDRFVDLLPRQEPAIVQATWKWLSGGSAFRTPEQPPPVIGLGVEHFAGPAPDGLRVTWLGHSTLLVEIEGSRVLIDPIWSERSSPFTWAGPRRFYPPPLALDALPKLDAVVISHDHYDHLDYPTVLELVKRSTAPFFVPLGVGAHLEFWGVPPGRIVELDWWQEGKVSDLTLVATPARHFSGRSLVMTDKDQTLWAGWAILGRSHRAYYSGDTAMFPTFAEIGQRLGPFDVTMIEAGAYNALWADVHLGPEQAVLAHRMVRGRLMIPVHWGLFDLALHGWTEPIERVIAAARAAGVDVATPRPGGAVDVDAAASRVARWWPEVEWNTALQEPVVSSGL